MNGACSSIASDTVSQPSRSSISGTPGPPHSDGSRCQTRLATESLTAFLTRSATGFSRSDGRLDWILGGRPVATAARRSSIPASSSFIASSNCLTPSTSSSSVTCRMSMPAAASASSASRGVLVGGRPGHLAVVGGGEQRRHRHRVDGVRRDQPVDVHRVGVVRVLGSGRRPQRPLHGGARVAQGVPAWTGEELLEADVRGPRIGERSGPREVGAPELLELAVDVGVNARDEEARRPS